MCGCRYCGHGCATPPYLDVMGGNAANQTDVYITKGAEAEEYTYARRGTIDDCSELGQNVLRAVAAALRAPDC